MTDERREQGDEATASGSGNEPGSTAALSQAGDEQQIAGQAHERANDDESAASLVRMSIMP